MGNQDRPRPIQYPPRAELRVQPGNISPEGNRRGLEPVNLELEKGLRVLEDKVELDVWVVRDDLGDGRTHAGEVGDHADFAEGLCRGGDDVVGFAAVDLADVEGGRAEDVGLRPGGGAELF